MTEPNVPKADSTSFVGKFLNGPQALAIFWKVVPFIGGALVARAWVSQDTLDYITGHQAELSGYIGVAATLIAGVFSLWKNRPSKRVADAAAIPGVDLAAPKELAAAATAVATPAAAASITAKAS